MIKIIVKIAISIIGIVGLACMFDGSRFIKSESSKVTIVQCNKLTGKLSGYYSIEYIDQKGKKHQGSSIYKFEVHKEEIIAIHTSYLPWTVSYVEKYVNGH